MELEQAFQQFERHLRSVRRSPYTLEAYRSDFKLFIEFLREGGVELQLEGVTTDVMEDYLRRLFEKGYADNAARRRLYSLKSYFDYCVRFDLLDKHPMRKLEIPRRERKPIKYFTQAQLVRLLETPKLIGGQWVFRNRVLLEILARTGIRRGELLALDWSDINFDEKTLMVRKGKGGRYRVIPLTRGLSALLKAFWLKNRPIKSRAVFVGDDGNKLGKRTLWKIFDRCLRFAGLEGQGFTIHSLRHTFATMLRLGCTPWFGQF